ncbi:hypothetical protein [Hymenobacter negativus]|uniref:PH domain-containing protein n=1 Tax=Hymenobacter negativus TaxID=2795026 RepID=A0ABS0Q5J3_9BACT|nr:hypothetical protein [Hymenobacter negativus]MBH8557932.1 hypothetical protein [Hymenobacter negativus]
MGNQFYFILTNRIKLAGLMIGGLLLLMFGLKTVDTLTAPLAVSKTVKLLVFLVWMAGGLYLLYRLSKKFSGEAALITISSDKLVIARSDAGTEKQILLASITAYRHSTYNSDDILRLKMRDGTRTSLVISDFFHGGQSLHFAAMVTALETAVAEQLRLNEQPVTLREKTLFEKPISTVLLGPFAALMVWMTWAQMHRLHTSGSFFSAWGIFSAYLVAWIAARERRNEK